MATTQTTPFRFLDLPPEIRNRIYLLLTLSPTRYISLNIDFHPSLSIPWSTEPSPHLFPTFPSSLLLTNTQLHHEAGTSFFHFNAFTLTVRRHNASTWAFFLSAAFAPRRRQMRALRLVLPRWGAKDFFTHELVPGVEDAILNGQLRVLEVLVKDSYVKRLEEGRWWEGRGEESRNWVALRRLCRDRDLEWVSVKAGPLEVFGDDVDGEEAKAFLDVTELVRGEIS